MSNRCRPSPGVGCTSRDWSEWIAGLTYALAAGDRQYLIVLDGFPTGTTGQLGDQVVELATHAGNQLHIVITASGNPAIDLAKLLTGQLCVRLSPELLTLDEREVTAVLSATGVDRPPPATVSAVRSHTHGWARGVTLAARLLAASIRDQRLGLAGHGFGTAMQDLDCALDALLDQEVLRRASIGRARAGDPHLGSRGGPPGTGIGNAGTTSVGHRHRSRWPGFRRPKS